MGEGWLPFVLFGQCKLMRGQVWNLDGAPQKWVITPNTFFPGAPSNFYAENASNFIKQNFMMWVFSIFYAR